MEIGICQICHKSFKLTKLGKLYRHGYKQYLSQKIRNGYLFSIIQQYMILTHPPCKGSGLYPVKLQNKKQNITTNKNI